MDSGSRARCPWQFLIVFSILCLQTMADDAGSLLLIDGLKHRYFRFSPSHPHQSAETLLFQTSMSIMEVGAAMSILLGLVPPSILSIASSSKLNEFLLPNPFDKPHHVLLLEIGLAEESQEMVYPDVLY
ncbi:unnamed protein product [Amaranthus hypochondriacus]